MKNCVKLKKAMKQRPSKHSKVPQRAKDEQHET
jgi:hypothetical protein